MSALDVIRARIRTSGAITLAEFMEIALYHPEHGYYAGAPQRSGRAGDFFTSVDVGPLFGEMLAAQFVEMHDRLAGAAVFDLVEVGAGNGRLTADVLDALASHHPATYQASRAWLVERSASARRAQADVLEPHRSRIAGSSDALPQNVSGVIFANELLDAFPAHAVVTRGGRLREVFIADQGGRLVEIEGEPSVPELATHFERVGAALPEGVRAEISPGQRQWVVSAANALQRGFLMLVDYGHRAAQLYSTLHAGGTLMAYRSHTAGTVDPLADPGRSDLTTHVDLTAIERAAEEAGLTVLGAVDQTYFLTALGIMNRLAGGSDRMALSRRLAAKTLIMPGGLGSTMKVMVFSKGVECRTLQGLSAGRLT